MMAFEKLEPFGGPVEDYRAALAATVAANLNRREGTTPMKWHEWYPWLKAPEPEEAIETYAERAERIRALFNSKAGKPNGGN